MFLIPTRERPFSMRELISACYLYGMPDRVAVMIDGEPRAYDSVHWPASWKIHYAGDYSPDGHLEMVRATNQLFELYPDEPWYGFLNDRARPRQPGWSEALISASGRGWANQASLGTNLRSKRTRMKNGVMAGSLVRSMGWFWPDWLIHFFVDDFWEEVLQGAGLWTQTDVKIEEQRIDKHPRVFKGEAFWQKDHDAFMAWLENKDATIERVRGLVAA